MNENQRKFNIEDFMPRSIFDRITEIRVENPEIIKEQALSRKKRKKLTRDGKLLILACDHPARGVTHTGKNPSIMGNRLEYLGRVLRILTGSNFDGVMAPPDLIEDLFIIDHLLQQAGGQSFLDESVLIGCMQRGGVAGVVGEINDRFGAYTAESIAEFRLDGGKMMYRFLPDDERTLDTIDYCSKAVTSLHRMGLFSFVEPLPQILINGEYKGNPNADVLVKLVNVSAALGESSQYKWLKIPYVDDFEKVTLATSLPLLMLGGPAMDALEPTLKAFHTGIHTRSNVRGAMVGRNLLFPGDEDPVAACLAVYSIIHENASVEEALEVQAKSRFMKMDALFQFIQ
jgi:DhnA family fructose-bisphosphate aldolase class Ia